MARILKKANRDFKEDTNKIDNFQLFSDASRIKNDINPKYLNFDLRQLNPGQFSAPFHFHRFAEELFMVVSGTEPCIYLDIRTFIGHDICEYPDSEKIFIAPSFEIFEKKSKVEYFKGEQNIVEKWKTIRDKNK
jgi:uncharacterized cupin superfamily protein